MNNHPIGILDSGVGGLTVLQSVAAELPDESIVYIGDSRNTPYGAKSSDEIYVLAKQLTGFLLKKKVKLIVIACNTITVSCLNKLRSDYPDIPIVGTVPVIKTAAEVSKVKRIGILSTTRTAQSDYQKRLINTFHNGCTVFNRGTDELVPFIESGRLSDNELAAILQRVLTPFKKEKVDALALGCTHFPFLKNQMQDFFGKDVQLLDSGGAIARQVRRVLEHNDALSSEKDRKVMIYTTGNTQIAKKLVESTIERKHLTVQKAGLDNDH